MHLNVPESGLGLASLLGDRSRGGLTSRALERSSGRVLTGHGSVCRSGGTRGSRSSFSCGVLVLEIEVLEGHFDFVRMANLLS